MYAQEREKKMTTYRGNDFNLWITVNGNEQRIVNDVVYIPFGT